MLGPVLLGPADTDLYWRRLIFLNFSYHFLCHSSCSGKPPSAGPGGHDDTHGDGEHGHLRRLSSDSDAAEVPRWCSSATVALSQYNNIVYKQMVNGLVGIWNWNGIDSIAIVEEGDNCAALDENGIDMCVETLALGPDGFRGARVVIDAACAAEEEEDSDEDEDSDNGDWGGIYLRNLSFVLPQHPAKYFQPAIHLVSPQHQAKHFQPAEHFQQAIYLLSAQHRAEHEY